MESAQTYEDSKLRSPPDSTVRTSRSGWFRSTEGRLAVGLTIVNVCLHVVRALHAGGLWRDEAATSALASSFSFQHVVTSSQYELFPALVPAVVHIYSGLAGNSDVALRILGLLVGLSIIAALWFNTLAVRKQSPLLGLALLGFSPALLQWGDTVRGYGLGICFIIATIGLTWRLIENPGWPQFCLAALAALAAVQCLFNNSAFVLAICLAALIVAARRRNTRLALLSVLAGVPALLSLLPYFPFLERRHAWDIVVRIPFNLAVFCEHLDEACGGSGWATALTASMLVLAGLIFSVWAQTRAGTGESPHNRDLLLFCGTALTLCPVIYFVFLKAAAYTTQLWYYLPLLALMGALLDLILVSPPRWMRLVRIVLTLGIAASGIVHTWRQAHVRQTSVDLLAAHLNSSADKNDLIIVSPWYLGITFERYYSGTAPWVTVPPIEYHKLHRYDLVKRQMLESDQDAPIRPVLEAIHAALSQGHRVWTVGEFPIPSPHENIPALSAAPDPKYGWNDRVYTLAWSEKIATNLASLALRTEEIPLGHGPVNLFENPPLTRHEGWRR